MLLNIYVIKLTKIVQVQSSEQTEHDSGLLLHESYDCARRIAIASRIFDV